MGRSYFGLMALLFALLIGCSAERPYRPIAGDGKRVAKRDLTGTFHYLRSLGRVDYARPEGELFAPGLYQQSDVLIQFVIHENALEIVAVDPLFTDESNAEKNRVLARFPVRHVDVLPKQNGDGEDTQEEELTESRRSWNQRDYVVVDLTTNAVDIVNGVRTVTPSTQIWFSDDRRSIRFAIQKQLDTGTVITEHYSFLRFDPSPTYTQRLFPRFLQERFGIYKTVTYQFDAYGRITIDQKKEFMSRRDLGTPIEYRLDPAFPEHLRATVREVFRQWNEALRPLHGGRRESLRLIEGEATEPGDLRYNQILYDESRIFHNLIGYGPSVTNPRTGEILKGDVVLYGGALRQAIYNERKWRRELKDDPAPDRRPAELDWAHVLSRMPNLDAIKVQQFRQWLRRPESLLTPFRQAPSLHSDRMSALGEDVRRAIAHAANDLSDEELEIRILGPLVSHELGHTLGLKHNFMASADAAHFLHGNQATSVMDYGFLASEEPIAPGPYDHAVLKVLYGDDRQSGEAVAQNFLYCSDENLYDSRLGLCHTFDKGTTLTDFAAAQYQRYLASYQFNNVRSDEVYFPKVDEAYLARVTSFLLPLRLTIDHANAILRNAREILDAGTGDYALTDDQARNLWRLLRQRIESPPGRDTFPLELDGGDWVLLNKRKLRDCVFDAERARELGVSLLALVARNEERPDYDALDPIYNDLRVRGALPDRLIALMLLGSKTPDPLESGIVGTPFAYAHNKVAAILTDVISNSETQKIPLLGISQTKFHVFNPNLRTLALDIVQDLIDSASLESGEARELIRVETGLPADDALYARLEAIRTDFQRFNEELERTEEPTRRAELENNIRLNRTSLAELKWTGIQGRDNVRLKAPMTLSRFDNIETASGHLIRDNLMLIEDQWNVLAKQIARLDDAIPAESDAARRRQLIAERRDKLEKSLIYARYVESERALVEDLYRRYRPR